MVKNRSNRSTIFENNILQINFFDISGYVIKKDVCFGYPDPT